MARRNVVGVTSLVGLLAIGESEAHLPLDHVAPAGELGAVVGQAAEELREVGVGGVRLEADRVAALEILQPHVEALECDLLGRRFSGYARHARLLMSAVDRRARLGRSGGV